MANFKPKAVHLFTGLNLYLEREAVGEDADGKPVYEYTVSLEGDNVKEERFERELDARRRFDETAKHYADREKTEPKTYPDGSAVTYKQFPLRAV